MKQLNEEMLVNVTGGDLGDIDKEIETGQPLYQMGEHVEVYLSIFHITTIGGTIVGIEKVEEGCYGYKVARNDNGKIIYTSANSIQRK